jgi:hypothetical protein
MVAVKFSSGVATSAALRMLADLDQDIQVASAISQIDVLELAVPVGSEWDVIEALRALPGVEYAEPNTLLSFH